MADTLKTIKAVVKEKLDGIDSIKEVIDYADGDFKEYPVAVLTCDGGTGETIDTHRKERTFNFVIKLYQEQSRAGKTKEEADRIMTSAVDDILILFDQDEDLGGQVEVVRVVGFDLDFKVAAGTYNFATIRVDCVVIVPSYEES